MTSAKGWILLSQRHVQFRDIDEADILDALPPEILRGSRQPVRIENHDPSRDPLQMDWDAMQRMQAAQVENMQLMELRDQGGGIAYFGRTLLPLAMDLGFRIEKWTQSRIFQYRERDETWHWPGRDAGEPGPEILLDDNLPSRASAASGDVIVRVSVSTHIAAQDAYAVVPGALGDIEIHLGARCSLDALRTPEELEAVARRFEDALYLVRERLPQASLIHVFLAGPVGLAFRMGCIVNHTVHARIQTYQFVQTGVPHKYQRALLLGRNPDVPVKLGILFLAAEPRLSEGQPQDLRIGQELRDICEQLRKGEHRDRFEELPQPHFAVRTTDIQSYVQRSRAQILHFSGHGETGGVLILEDPSGRPQRVIPESMRLLFEWCNDDHHIRCAVLNACRSNGLAIALTRAPAVVRCAVGTVDKVSDKAAVAFSTRFYQGLADGLPLQQAFDGACVQVGLISYAERALYRLSVADEALRDRPLFAP